MENITSDTEPNMNYAAVKILQEDDFTFHFQTLPIPKPGPTDVLVKLSMSGVCGTDIALATGKIPTQCKILGHEGVGRVVQLGSALSTSHVSLGQRVGVGWVRGVCGNCVMCRNESGETRCLKQQHSGRAVEGTFAEYTVVPYNYLMPIPETLKDEEVAPILCGGVTVYKALKICGAKAGQWIIIAGAGGGVGALGIQYAKAMGFCVIASDVGEVKRSFCESLGADLYVDSACQNLKEEVRKIADDYGARAAIVVAGSVPAYQASLESLGPFGTLVCVGIPPPAAFVNFHPIQFIDMGVRIVGSMVGTRADVLEALDFVAKGKVTPTVKIARLEDLDQMVLEFKTGKVLGKWVLDLKSAETL